MIVVRSFSKERNRGRRRRKNIVIFYFKYISIFVYYTIVFFLFIYSVIIWICVKIKGGLWKGARGRVFKVKNKKSVRIFAEESSWIVNNDIINICWVTNIVFFFKKKKKVFAFLLFFSFSFLV